MKGAVMKMRFSTSLVAALLIAAFAVTLSAQEAAKAEPPKPTPRAADGHPDLSGVWIAGNRGIRPATENASIKVVLPLAGVDQDKDNVFAALDRISVTERAKDTNKPQYKPELLAKVKDLEVRQSQEDPAFYCKPAGVPRMGPPAQIIQLPDKLVFLYATNLFRLVPINAPHRTDIDTSYMGDSVAKWDGETLVVDVNNLNDDTWLGADGYFHTEALHVVERFTRTGDTMRYDVTVEDPNVLSRPWTMNPRTLRLGNRPLEEGPPCVEKDAEHLVTLDHH
jgi:hypothetical protein